MKDLIRKILLESDWDWVDEIQVVPPHPLSEEALPLLVGWSFLYDEYAPRGGWAYDGKLFKITRVLGNTIYWLYGNGNEENSDSTSSFIKQVNDGYWVLVSPEGILYDPLYKRDWKGGTHYSKEDLTESLDWGWVMGETLLPLSDYVYEYKIEDLNQLIGIKVKLSPESRYYKEQLKYVDDYPLGDRENPIDVIGIIVGAGNGIQKEDNLPLSVKWTNDTLNNYSIWDLDISL